VLEQTITERLPRVEHRLSEAKKLLFQRDRELTNLTQSSHKQAQALEEAKQINAQQRDEVHRLNATLATRAARNREALTDPRFEGEVALRSEIESLRAKTQDQSALIAKLQGVLSQAGVPEDRIAGSGALSVVAAGNESEISRLRQDLADAEMALRSVRGAAEAGQAGQSVLADELRQLKAKTQDQNAEIANLKASLNLFQSVADDDKAIVESKIALKARLSALQAKADEQVTTIQTLRNEIAVANEKLARQAAHFMDEMRRLGVGTLPASGPQRRTSYEAKRPSLSERIAAPRPVAANDQAAAQEPPVTPFGAKEPVEPVAQDGATEPAPVHRLDSAAASAPAATATDDARGARRPGLLERISGMEKGSGAA
jgi:chromosome segregation ATPase